jgi:hypothetical protein
MARKIVSVSFSLDDPFEKELYEYVLTKGVFSRYIKRLIDKDRILIPVESEVKKPKDVRSFL